MGSELEILGLNLQKIQGYYYYRQQLILVN